LYIEANWEGKANVKRAVGAERFVPLELPERMVTAPDNHHPVGVAKELHREVESARGLTAPLA
jgi:hypothetical protein